MRSAFFLFIWCFAVSSGQRGLQTGVMRENIQSTHWLWEQPCGLQFYRGQADPVGRNTAEPWLDLCSPTCYSVSPALHSDLSAHSSCVVR